MQNDTVGSPATVHLILHAHLDPVWLWPWQAGMDEAIATCRSACDRLDRHPDIFFTQGEAWIYDIVERTDPALFRRIARHVETGRWEITGGWWIQPDCNLPGGAGMRKQIELGRKYFQERFGQFPRIACNVDSFGHAAALPALMRACGQDRYVMMRPQEHELALPARLFRWRGYDGGAEVTTFRIARNYETYALAPEHVGAALEHLPPGVTHTACFIGLGDHGGGPTEKQIAWCRDNAQSLPGCRLVFSTLTRFFDAVEGAALPLVTGELQHHAVGCYSVMRSIKLGVRDAEERLQQADVALAHDPAPDPGTAAKMAEAWHRVCFNHFHDTLGGTCIASAYPQMEDQLGAAKAVADDVLQMGFRRRLQALPPDERQRIVLCNASDRPFDGYVTLAPWTEARWSATWRLLDETGANVPYQIVPQEAATRFAKRIVLAASLAPGEMKALRLDRSSSLEDAAVIADPAVHDETGLHAGAAAVAFDGGVQIRLGALTVAPRLVLSRDGSDTWSHGVERFDATPIEAHAWGEPAPLLNGPLMCSIVQSSRIGRSDVLAEWRVSAGRAEVELFLRIHWHASHELLKLVVALPDAIAARVDGVMDGALDRGRESRERPLRDFTLVRLHAGRRLGIVCPDCFAIDAGDDFVGLTLLRSPFMAHHDPADLARFPTALPADQGMHTFRFAFLSSEDLDAACLEARAHAFHRPPLTSDWTKGMTSRSAL